MKNKFLAGIVALGIFSVAMAHADVTYTTSKGAVFAQVQGPGSFGKAWKDPSGMIWSSYQGDFTNVAIKPDQNDLVTDSLATEACAKIGGSLPTADDFERFESYFDCMVPIIVGGTPGYSSAQCYKDYIAIFPDAIDGNGVAFDFWSSSIVTNPPPSGACFLSVFGGFNVGCNPDDRAIPLGVRCVSR